MTQLARTAPPPPWQRQPGEAEIEWLTFLAWALGDRPALNATEDSRLAAVHRWHVRAQQIDSRLRPAETPSQAVASIAQDALVVLRHELAWRASQAVTAPGQASLGELVQLLKLCSDLGLSAAQQPSADAEAPVDYSTLTPEELAILAQASAIIAKAKGAA